MCVNDHEVKWIEGVSNSLEELNIVGKDGKLTSDTKKEAHKSSSKGFKVIEMTLYIHNYYIIQFDTLFNSERPWGIRGRPPRGNPPGGWKSPTPWVEVTPSPGFLKTRLFMEKINQINAIFQSPKSPKHAKTANAAKFEGESPKEITYFEEMFLDAKASQNLVRNGPPKTTKKQPKIPRNSKKIFCCFSDEFFLVLPH